MKALIIIALTVASIGCFAQDETKEERKANRERVKAEQKLLNQQAKDEKRAASDQARNAPTWTTIEAEPSDIKGALIQHMRGWGYTIESETDHQITFWKEASGRDAFVMNLFHGNSYSENPKKHVQYTLVPDSPGLTRVDVDGLMTIKNAFGKEDRVVMTNAPAFKQNVTEEFNALRSWAQHEKEVKASTASVHKKD